MNNRILYFPLLHRLSPLFFLLSLLLFSLLHHAIILTNPAKCVKPSIDDKDRRAPWNKLTWKETVGKSKVHSKGDEEFL